MTSFTSTRLLFAEQELIDILRDRTDELLAEVDGYRPNELLNTGTERLLEYFHDKYSIDFPVLQKDQSVIDHEDMRTGAQGYRGGQPLSLPGTRYFVKVPFMGDARIFNSRPSRYSAEPPKAHLEEDSITFFYLQTRHNEDALATDHGRDIATVEQYLQWLGQDVASFNTQLRERASAAIQSRRAKLLADQRVAASLGIQLARANLPATYAIPEVRRRASIVRPAAGVDPFVPEPELEMEEYEHILKIVRDTSLVIERSPSTFATAREPVIRDHFLVQLNGHYEGQATGETFNCEGQADILIRWGNKNVFVAELKFWDGPKSATDALTQILERYTTWRDSKIALIILNRGSSFTDTLAHMPDAMAANPNVIRRIDMASQTDFRYVLRHPDDPNRELMLTVLCFEVPGKRRPQKGKSQPKRSATASN